MNAGKGMKNIYISFIVILILTLFFPSSSFAQSRTTRFRVPVNKTIIQVEKKNNKVTKKVLIQDYLSSTKFVLNENGKVASIPSYYPYGSSFVPLSLAQSARQYTGQRKVSNDSSVYNYNARFYNPQTGVFIQPDSVEGPTRYTYVSGNPIMLNDPSGNCPTCIVGAIAGAALDIGFQTLVQGRDFSQISLKSVFFSAASGAIGSGISAKIGQIATTTASKVVMRSVGSYATDFSVAAIDSVISNEPMNMNSSLSATEAVSGNILNAALGSSASTGLGTVTKYATKAYFKTIDQATSNPVSFEQQRKDNRTRRQEAFENRFYTNLASMNTQDASRIYDLTTTLAYSLQAIKENRERIRQIGKKLGEDWRVLDNTQKRAYFEQARTINSFVKQDQKTAWQAFIKIYQSGVLK